MTQQSKNDAAASLNVMHSTGGATEFDALVTHLMGKKQTITLVQVVSVQATGVAPVGFVDVKPMVHQIDGSGNVYELGTLFNVPYFRLQGGANAVICDPKVGDIGLCAFASRDISTVKRTKKAAAPSSKRQFDWSDGLYLGGFLNGIPEQYVFFKDGGGIDIVSTGDINLRGNNIIINAKAGVSTTSQTFQANSTQAAKFTGKGGIDAEGEIKSDTDVKAKSISLIGHDHEKGVGKPT